MTDTELMYLITTINLATIVSVFHRTDFLGFTSLNSLLYDKSTITNSMGQLATRSSDMIAIYFSLCIVGLVASTLYDAGKLIVVLMALGYLFMVIKLKPNLVILNNNINVVSNFVNKGTNDLHSVYPISMRYIAILYIVNIVYVVIQVIKGI